MNYITSRFTGLERVQIGQAREQQFFDAFYKFPVELLDDVYRVERGTVYEDLFLGIDGWVYTEYGRIPLQVTSSRDCVDKHVAARPNSDAVMITVYETDTPAEIQNMTMQRISHRLERLRKKAILQERKEEEWARW
jgi:hypothetical protein